MNRIIITGVNGFVGKHLVRELNNNGYSLIGVGREASVCPEIQNEVEAYYSQDVAESWPDITENHVRGIVNLAGLAAVGPSFDHPQKYININSAIVTNICEYYINKLNKPRILSISSGAVYSPNQSMPINEKSKLSNSSPYTVSKILNELQLDYYRHRGLDCITVRPFNHFGPDQLGGFLVPDLVEKLIEARRIGYIKVGNLKTKRDYTDVRDVVRSYRLLLETNELNYNTYNVCSGQSISGEEILSILQNIMKIDNIKTKVDSKKIRPNDPDNIVGSSKSLYDDTGWRPTIPIEQTLRDIVAQI